jgi:hypothetical protein
MFHDHHLGHGVANLDALNRARLSLGLEPYHPPNRSQTGALIAISLIVALLMVLVT